MNNKRRVANAIDQVRQGDDRYEDFIFKYFSPDIERFASRGIRALPLHDAEDIVGYVMKSFLSGIRNGEFDECQDDIDARNLLAVMTRRKIQDRRRHWIRPKHTNVMDQTHDEGGHVPESETGRVREFLRHHLDQLPTNCRMVATAFYLDGLSFDEVARKLTISLSSVEAKLKRIRQWVERRRYLPKPFASEELMANLMRNDEVWLVAAAREVNELVDRALDEGERTLLRLRHEGYTFPEIADQLGIPEHKARRSYNATIASLKKKYQGAVGDE